MEPPPHQTFGGIVLTEEDRQIFKECNRESLFYRALPCSAFSMLTTQLLIKKGTLTGHPRFGAVPKLIFAAIFGYIAGKISYMEKCKEKFMKLENSQVGELLRKKRLPENSQQPRFSYVPSSAAPVGESPQPSKYTVDNYGAIDFRTQHDTVPFSSSMNESSPSGISDSPPPEHVPLVEEGAKRKITYEELRSKNREMYGAGIQKSDILSKPSQERPFKNERTVNVNKYGDAWED